MTEHLIRSFYLVALDILPIAAILFSFQFLVLRKPLLHARQIISGFIMTWVGLSLFLVGLEMVLFPIGSIMAEQLIRSETTADGSVLQSGWRDYLWIYLFALSMGAATTMAEPSLIAVAAKAHDVSSGAIRPVPLRIAVAVGVALGMTLGCWRIVTGVSLIAVVAVLYVLIVIQTRFSPRFIVPIAYDSGGVTTSTITIPIIAALGMGLAAAIPGRDPLTDGFGLIILSCMMPMITVLGYAQLAERRRKHQLLE